MNKWTWVVLVVLVAVLGLGYSVLQQRRAAYSDPGSEISVEEYESGEAEYVPTEEGGEALPVEDAGDTDAATDANIEVQPPAPAD